MTGYYYLFVMLILTTAGQLFTKLTSQQLDRFNFIHLLKCPYAWLTAITIAAGPFFVNLALDYLELSVVFAFTGLYFISVPLAARVFLKESITKKMVWGMLLIVMGVTLFNL